MKADKLYQHLSSIKYNNKYFSFQIFLLCSIIVFQRFMNMPHDDQADQNKNHLSETQQVLNCHLFKQVRMDQPCFQHHHLDQNRLMFERGFYKSPS